MQMHKPKFGQMFRGNENVLIVAPAELRRATVRVDGDVVGYLWSIAHMKSSGVEHLYKPSLPSDIDDQAGATRVFIDEAAHEIAIESAKYARITRQIGPSAPRPLIIVISRDELRPLAAGT